MGTVRRPPGLRGPLVRLQAWRWVVLYTVLLLGSLPFTRGLLDALERRNLSGLLAWLLLTVCIGGVVCLFLRVRRVEGTLRLRVVLRMLAFVALYLYALANATSLTVERVHFLQYGLLGVLCYRAVGEERPGWSAVLAALVAVYAIGCLDEIVQGFLAGRYFDRHDLALDVLAGALPILGIRWLPVVHVRERTGGMGGPPRVGSGDAAKRRRGYGWAGPGLVLVLTTGAVLWVGVVKLDPHELAGTWERRNGCGITERVVIGEDGQLTWRDAEGGRASGTYAIAGNRLDGPLLTVRVGEGRGTGACAWRGGERRDRYLILRGDRLVFRKEPAQPFRRVPPERSAPSR